MTAMASTVFSSEVEALTVKTIDAVLFDLDGTLIDSVPDLAAAIDVMLLAIGKSPAGDVKVNRWVGNGAAALVKRALYDHDDGDVLHQQEFSNELEDSFYMKAYALFESAYAERLTQATGLYPRVETVLARLNHEEIKMALITNKPRVFTLPLLRSLDIEQYFSSVVCGDDLEHKKPHPLPIETALNELAIHSDHAVMVGDSISDVKSAYQAGVKSIAVTYGYNHGVSITDSSNEMRADVFIDEIQQLLS